MMLLLLQLLLLLLGIISSFAIGKTPNYQTNLSKRCILSFISPHTDNHQKKGTTATTTARTTRTKIIVHQQRRLSEEEDIFSAVHRKEYEMRGVNSEHSSSTDPVRMALGYFVEPSKEKTEEKQTLRLAGALRRVYDDPTNTANPSYNENKNKSSSSDAEDAERRREKLLEHGLKETSMRRGSFIVDIKRRSLLSHPNIPNFANFDNAGSVARAMVELGADAVFINVDYHAYGGDISELKSAVRQVRSVSDTAAVIMKDIVVDEIQLGLAKDAGADGILLIASVLGPSLENFLNHATCMGLETIVECHTKNEIEYALSAMAQNIMVSNYDRIGKDYHPQQAIQLAGLFPGSGGSIVTLACGGIQTPDQMKKLLAVGYDGVVVGKAIMGNTAAPEFIRAVRDRSFLPAEFSQWGFEDAVDFDSSGNLMP